MDEEEGFQQPGWDWLIYSRSLNLVVTALACMVFELPLPKLLALLAIALTIVALLHRIMQKQNRFENDVHERLSYLTKKMNDVGDKQSS